MNNEEYYVPTPRRRDVITPAMAEAILHDYRDPGCRVMDICEHYRIPVSRLYRLIREHGVPRRNPVRQEPLAS